MLNYCRRYLLFLSASLLCTAGAQAASPVQLATTDGWKLAALYEPATAEQKTVILLHDLGKSKEHFKSFCAALTNAGFGYLALDLRGHGQSTGGGIYRSFAKEGVDNPFNKMTRDVEAAVNFLREQGVADESLVLLGTGLGANVAAKSTTFWPEIAFVVLLSPTANTRDVLTIPAIRLYKGDVLIGAAAADKKLFLEASVIRNVAYLATGPDNGKITFLTAYDQTSHDMLDQYFIPAVIQWLKTPRRPEILPDSPQAWADTPVDTTGTWVAPSATEEALAPSVLGE